MFKIVIILHLKMILKAYPTVAELPEVKIYLEDRNKTVDNNKLQSIIRSLVSKGSEGDLIEKKIVKNDSDGFKKST